MMKSNSSYLSSHFCIARQGGACRSTAAIFIGVEHLVYSSLRILGIGDAGRR